MRGLTISIGLVLIAATLLPLLRKDAWWIRVFDFPRVQIALACVLVLLVYSYVWGLDVIAEWLWAWAIVLGAMYQGYRMYPYSPLAEVQVLPADTANQSEVSVSLMVANVLMSNLSSDRLLGIIEREQPDILLLVETDAWWASQLEGLDAHYPHSVKHPLPNTYGMMLFSAYPLKAPRVETLIDDDVPSVHTVVELSHRTWIWLSCLHPKPPAPQEATVTTPRDAELLWVARQIFEKKLYPAIVAGDLNDVAWSYTTRRFTQISGLLDPRIGRGMFNSFHAQIPLVRFPVDHVFHSRDFRLVDLRRLDYFGSDHYPMLVTLSYEPQRAWEHPKPRPNGAQLNEAQTVIREARARCSADPRPVEIPASTSPPTI